MSRPECFAELGSSVASKRPQTSDVDMELPDLGSSPEESGRTNEDFLYMVRELDLLPYGETSTNTMTA